MLPEGTGYRARTRFAKFFNLPELMTMFKEVADIKTSDQLHLPVPEAKFETVLVKPSEIQKEMVQSLSERAAKINAGTSYPATFTPTANYQWWDGTTGAKMATWAIGKGNQVVTVSPETVTLNTSARSAKFTVTRLGDGVITATTNDSSVATVSNINQSTGEVTVNSVNDKTGNTTITVKVAAGTNYLAGADKQVAVKAQFVTIYGVEWDWTSGSSTPPAWG